MTPPGVSVAEAGLIWMVLMTCRICTAAVSATWQQIEVATMRVLPMAFATTRPMLSTAAVAGFMDVQVTRAPDTERPVAS